MQKTLFLCSRMAPFNRPDLRSELIELFGSAGTGQSAFRLHIEDRDLQQNEDARMFCARAIQESDGVVLILDGSSSLLRNPLDAPVLELEVMLAAACDKPVFVLDGSDGKDPLYRLLGSEFFRVKEEAGILPLRGAEPEDKIKNIKEMLEQTCKGEGPGATTLSESVGWEKLFLARPDRLDEFEEDGGNFPFAQHGLDLTEIEMSSMNIEEILDRAEESFKADKMAALVLGWDAIRALSSRPWGTAHLEPTIAKLWLRSLSIWGGAMAWLGLFGHSSGAAMMANLACFRIASRADLPETKDGGPFAAHKFQGGLASTYFSLSKLVTSKDVQRAIRIKGISHATDALHRTSAPRDQAGLLAVRGPLLLSTRSSIGVFRGFQDLRLSVQLHEKASAGNGQDHGVATSRIQLGAAYKELAKRTLLNRIFLTKGHSQLKAAYEVLAAEHNVSEEIDGQLLMCMKHLIETLWFLRRESEAFDLWKKATSLANKSGVTDQLRQLRDIARATGWDECWE